MNCISNNQIPLNYFDDLIKNLKDFYDQREAYLKELDIAREKNTNWYKRQ